MNIEVLKKLGSEWQKGEMHRIYFNDLNTWFGLKLWHYNTGNISGAELDGETISNTSARNIGQRLAYAKVWYDVPTGQFRGKDIKQDDLDKIVGNIQSKVQELEVA